MTPEEMELATKSSREDDSSPEAASGMDDMRDSFTQATSSHLSQMDSGMSITSPSEDLSISAKRSSSTRRSGLHRPGGGYLLMMLALTPAICRPLELKDMLTVTVQQQAASLQSKFD